MYLLTNNRKLRQDTLLKSLLAALAKEALTLRELKLRFKHIQKLDRAIDSFIDLGLIKRENKRYFLAEAPIAKTVDATPIVEIEVAAIEKTPHTAAFFYHYFDKLQGSLPDFCLLTCELADTIQKTYRLNQLKNANNAVVFCTLDDLAESQHNLYHYFSHQDDENLNEIEQVMSQLIGDVNPDYALKYMTAFLLKLLDKKIVKYERKDIFIQALADFQLIEHTEAGYQLSLPFWKINAENAQLLADLAKIEAQFTDSLTANEAFITRQLIHQQVYDRLNTKAFAFWTLKENF
ncbi:MAG: DUF1803 domain-containing protein [Streptococcaceae bacterium]|jgi:hypothetical protein|nr:DUF1803 domain-containing protein [Streptococcaceae bacterium]